MPGGLRDVTQRFDADATGYIAEAQKIIAANREIVASTAQVRQAMAQAQSATGGVGAAPGIQQANAAIREQLAALREHQAQMAAAMGSAGSFGSTHVAVAAQVASATSAIQAHTGSVYDLQAGYDAARASVAAMAADALRANDQMASSFERVRASGAAGHDQVRAFSSGVSDLRSSAPDTAAAVDDVSRSIENLRARADSARSATASAVSDIAAAGSLRDMARMMDQRAAAEGYASYRDAAIAAFGPPTRAGGGGGGGGPIVPVGGGGGGGGGGGTPSFVPWAGGGWNAVRFWGMMSAEVLSTVVPAAVAAGAATLVGMQGGEQLVNRGNAIFSTAEAIGGAYGQTAGSFIAGGKYGSALQAAQNYATGGVYELAGAGINLLRSGAGQGLLTEGVGTIGMLDRAAANTLINVQANNTGARLAAAMGGGTDYLRQFGAIGGNLGNTFLNLAPYLPGVGSDLLGGLMGGTGLLARTTGFAGNNLGPLLGGLLAGEAASRWGPALLGGQGLIGRMLGLGGVGGLGGLLSKGGTALATRGMGGILGDLGLGMIGAGDTLAGLTGGTAGLMGAAGYGLWQFANIKPSADRQMSALQGQISQSGFTQAWQPLAHAIVASYAGAANQATVKEMTSLAAIGPFGAGGGAWVTDKGLTDAAYGTSFTSQMSNLLTSGPQLIKALQSGPNPLGNVSMGQAYQIAQMALLNVSDAFGKNGQLTPTAVKQLQDYGSGIRPMTQSGGAFGAAVSGQYIMSQSAVKDVSQLNQSMDSLTQIMESGPVGLSSLSATAQSTPASLAKALTSFTSSGSAAAWAAFANPSSTQPGIITQLQQQMDQYRTAEALGALSGTQAAGLTGYALQKFLPSVKDSPAALAMLMQQGAQAGVTGYYDPSKTLAQNYQAAAQATKAIADNTRQANQATTQMITGGGGHSGLANLPATAANFLGTLGSTLQSQQVSDAATQILGIRNAALGGKVNQGGVQSLLADMQSSGLSGGALKSSFNAALSQAGVSQHMVMTIDAKYNIGKPPPPPQGGTVNYPTKVQTPKNPPPTPGGLVTYPSAVTKPIAPPPPAGGTVVYHSVVIGPTGQAVGGVGASVGSLGNTRLQAQTGGRVPGSGSGDIVPAMLEPGEAVVPRNLVPLIAPFLAAHGVPGFGSPQGAASHFAAGGLAGGGPMGWTVTNSGGQLPLPASVQKILDQILGSIAHSPVWHQFGLTFMGQFQSSIRNLPAETKSIASALVNQITAEVNYAKGVAGAAQQGQGYGTQGLISGWNVTPGTGNGTVFEQMQSYLGGVQSFTKDIAALRKGGLNKDLIGQMVAAGPVQGDALAQSVMQDYGGIKGVNQLYAQIGKASNALGAQAAMAKYGGVLAPDLKSGTFSTTNNTVNISVSAQGGATLSLTTAQVNALVAEIQAKLLQQARRNPQTGVKAKGKSA